jgi:2,3-bisphosphoglycerate-dependent phosphoglycerate mutase
MPRLRHGQNVLVVAHGNSIRSLIKYIENISNSEIGDIEMLQNAALYYEVDNEGRAKFRKELPTT